MNSETINKTKNELLDVDKVKKLCDSKGWSVAELGRRIGMPKRELISRRLNRAYPMTIDEAYLIADELEITVDDLRLR